MTARHATERPCAAHGLTSYRYKGHYGWIMIGAKNNLDALNEARRSITGNVVSPDRLQIWNGSEYVDAIDDGSRLYFVRVDYATKSLQSAVWLGETTATDAVAAADWGFTKIKNRKTTTRVIGARASLDRSALA